MGGGGGGAHAHKLDRKFAHHPFRRMSSWGSEHR